MAGVNKVILVGHLGRDPEMRYTQGGSAVCNFTLATSERFKDRDGNNQERTEWHRVVAWARLAEICGEYLRKGRLVYVEGRLQTRDWEDREGHKRYTTEVVAVNMQMLGGRGADAGASASGSAAGGERLAAEAPEGPAPAPDEPPPQESDIPF